MLTNQMENSKNTTAIGLNNDLAMVFMVNDLKNDFEGFVL